MEHIYYSMVIEWDERDDIFFLYHMLLQMILRLHIIRT